MTHLVRPLAVSSRCFLPVTSSNCFTASGLRYGGLRGFLTVLGGLLLKLSNSCQSSGSGSESGSLGEAVMMDSTRVLGDLATPLYRFFSTEALQSAGVIPIIIMINLLPCAKCGQCRFVYTWACRLHRPFSSSPHCATSRV